MSVIEVQHALKSASVDDALARHFLTVWPVMESILEAFSKATGLPIFAYLSDSKVFQSSMETMPPFCTVMLNSDALAHLCVEDGLRRAKQIEPDITGRSHVQFCHAGMVNGRCDIETGCVGVLTVLFGSKKSLEPLAVKRRAALVAAIPHNSEDAKKLERADKIDSKAGIIDESDVLLMNAISDILKQLIEATVGFRSLTINMAHELSLMMLDAGLLAREMKDSISDLAGAATFEDGLATLVEEREHIDRECQLGLYIVRNFLSHASEARYHQVIRPKFEQVNLVNLLTDMIDLHRRYAKTKGVSFDVNDLSDVPPIYGSEMEISRLFHNVFNNAIKYSYRSLPAVQRTIRIRSKVPYDPGFRRRRFSITVENYGLGISKSEGASVFKPGVRGEQAIAEVPVGSGIGLSEAMKIMQLHNGDLKFRSHPLHEGSTGRKTYLTEVELIFPYRTSAMQR